jgi:hypothetical protein
MNKSFFAVASLAALLLAAPATYAQQTVVKTKTKSAKNARAAATMPVPTPGMAPTGVPAGPPPPPAGGPRGEQGPGGPRGERGPDGRSHFHFVSLASGGQTVRDTPPVRPTTAPTEETATVRGTIRELRRGPRGEIKSLVLSDQSILQLPPRAVEQLADKLTTGASLEATGTLRTAHPGEALASTTPVRVVRAETLTLGGNKYLVR